MTLKMNTGTMSKFAVYWHIFLYTKT